MKQSLLRLLRHPFFLFLTIGLMCPPAQSQSAPRLTYPPTAQRPITDQFHGTAVIDPYRWLEDDRSEEVKEWVRAQNKLTRQRLELAPLRSAIERRTTELLSEQTARWRSLIPRAGKVFALKFEPPKKQPQLVVLANTLDPASERVVLDLNVLDPEGATAIDFFMPSFDGKYVAICLSNNGSEEGTARIYEVATAKVLPDTIARVAFPTGGGSFAWSADSKTLYYTRYPAPKERPAQDARFYQTVWRHQLHSPVAQDRYVVGKEFPRIAETELVTSRDGKQLLALVRNGDGGEVGFYLQRPNGSWQRIADFKDGVKQMQFGDDGQLYALSVKNAPLGRLLVLPLARPVLAQARVALAQAKRPLVDFSLAAGKLQAAYQDGGPILVERFTRSGQAIGPLSVEDLADISFGGALDNDRFLIRSQSYLHPPRWLIYDAKRDVLSATALSDRSAITFTDALVERGFASSTDGTLIPITLVRKKDAPRDGSVPTILYAYGGYGAAMSPYFDRMLRLWLDLGGAYAVAGVRGGGEYGEPWHEAGKLERKQTVFDDFAACMQWLVTERYTRPERLAIMGASNGGLTMGAALTQHPTLMRAVVSSVGIYDPLHWEEQDNGAFNVTEFGSVKVEAQFRAMLAYSPLQNVRDGTAYPAVLLTSGDNDGRVAPYESRKMAARLQAATSSVRPILLRTDAAAGHGVGSSLPVRIAEETDIYTFLATELDIKALAP